ncbi:hypothetical protein GCM10017744_093980 [Streptomyces antimycoticus]|uniref:Uncharacterized protein n=2 Tax=Streptomyces antimycoticus TaxID=68175 RepID=A0A4D4K0F2_9ACTN|nr:hypothetical protein SANT12839_006090 [Streptomyces antimycoticus]
MVPWEDTSNRRVDVLGAQSVGAGAGLVWQRTAGKIDAQVLLEFVCARLAGLPGGPAPWPGRRWPGPQPAADPVPVPAVHGGAGQRLRVRVPGVQGPARAGGLDRGGELFHLPPRGPELNDIELVRRRSKYQNSSTRSRTSVDAIGVAVDGPWSDHATGSDGQHRTSPKPLDE